jgi:glutathione S-transferase
MLARSAGAFCVGDQLTLADCFLIPQLYNAKRYGVDLSPYPTIERLSRGYDESDNLAIIASHPDRCPDAVPL